MANERLLREMNQRIAVLELLTVEALARTFDTAEHAERWAGNASEGLADIMARRLAAGEPEQTYYHSAWDEALANLVARVRSLRGG